MEIPPPDPGAIAGVAPPRLTLADRLARITADHRQGIPLTMNSIFARTEGRGIFLVVVLLCLPFVAPVSIPGFSNVLGPILLLLGVRIAVGLPPILPRLLGERELPARIEKILEGSVKLLRFLERWVHPRQTPWLRWPAARFANGVLIGLMAALLGLPIPPIIPLSNMFPAIAILLIALSMMEEDGMLIWAGYFVAAFTVGYFLVWADVIVWAVLKYSGPVRSWLGI